MTKVGSARRAVGLVVAIAGSLGVLSTGIYADGFPDTLREAVTVTMATASVTFTEIGPQQPAASLQIVGDRMATTTELRRDTLVDSDGDGIPGILDSAPMIASLGSPDGSFGDIQTPGTGDTFSEFYRARGFASAGQLIDAILAANEAEGVGGSTLYPPEELISIAADGGLPADQIAVLEEKYACGKEIRKRCHDRCEASFPPPRNEGAGREYARCVQKCQDIPKCKTKAPKQAAGSKGGR